MYDIIERFEDRGEEAAINPTRRKTVNSLEDRVRIISLHKSGMDKREISQRLKMPKQTVETIIRRYNKGELKNQDMYKNMVELGGNSEVLVNNVDFSQHVKSNDLKMEESEFFCILFLFVFGLALTPNEEEAEVIVVVKSWGGWNID